MVLESACIPVPSEVTMIYAGYLVSQGTFSFVAAVLVGSFANLVGSWIAWAAGAYGVDAVLVRGDHAREELARTQRLLDRYGGRVVFFARMVPLVRTFVSLPAGMARMPLGRFHGVHLPGLPAVVCRAGGDRKLRRQQLAAMGASAGLPELPDRGRRGGSGGLVATAATSQGRAVDRQHGRTAHCCTYFRRDLHEDRP